MYQTKSSEEIGVQEQNLIEDGGKARSGTKKICQNSGRARSGKKKLCIRACRNARFPIFLLVILLKKPTLFLQAANIAQKRAYSLH